MRNRIYRSECYANRDLAASGVRSAAEIRAATDKILRRHDARGAAARAKERIACVAYVLISAALPFAIFYFATN